MLARNFRVNLVAPLSRASAGLRRIGLLAVATFGLTACAVQKNFVVDTASGSDPLIESPYKSSDGFLRIPIPSVALSCSEASVPFMGGNIALSTRRADRASYFASNRSVMARISEPDARKFAASMSKDGLEDLQKTLETGLPGGKASCALVPDCQGASCGAPAAIAAESILRHLPRHYSSMLRDRYNHRVWTKGNTSYGLSFDLFPGMRLRIENSLPISPAGFGAKNAYPSSFAAPTYIYVHTLTGTEICATDTPLVNSQDNFVCKLQNNEQERFMSLTSGMARWGTRQVDSIAPAVPLVPDASDQLPLPAERGELQKAIDSSQNGAAKVAVAVERKTIEELLAPPSPKTVQNQAEDASGLIDLFERSNVTSGARKHWRLWIPMSRTTPRTANLPMQQPGAGSVEPGKQLPMLISADSLQALDSHKYDTDIPCQQSEPETSCHQLRYRVVPIPEVLAYVNQVERWVPVGSTLLDLVAHNLHTAIAAVHFSKNKQTSVAPPAEQAAQIASHEARRSLVSRIKVSRMFEGRRVAVVPSSLLSPVEVDRFLRLQIVAGDEIEWK